MNVNFNSISFKGYVPVRVFIKSSPNGTYCPVSNPQKVRSCSGHLVRNLNKTIKKPDSKFVKYFASYDKDYREKQVVHSIYDIKTPNVYFVTGNNVRDIENMAKPVGRAKNESIKHFGHANNYEAKEAAKKFFYDAKRYMRNSCPRVKDLQGNPLTLAAYFDAKCDNEGNLKEFKFKGAEFVKDLNNNPQLDVELDMKPQEPICKQLTIDDFI